jgi:hypothetical protein
VNAYLLEGTLPAAGTTCRQEVPFAQSPVPASASAAMTRRALAQVVGSVLHRRALLR